LRSVRVTIDLVEKEQLLNITSVRVCILALVVRHSKRMRHVRLSFVAWPAVPIFPHRINGTIFGGKNVIEHKIFVLIFPGTFVGNISHSEQNWAGYYHKFTYFVM
jgi:hypothetical protein